LKRTTMNNLVAVCLHPAIDRTFEVPEYKRGEVVRGKQVMVEPAGKGVNVAQTLANLGHSVVATGFLGRREMELFRGAMDSQRIDFRFVPVEAATRDNLTIIEKPSRRDTHILDSPMEVTRDELNILSNTLSRYAKAGGRVVFSGSAPKGVRQGDFAEMLALCAARKADVCVDASGGLLRAALKARPWLIKPNVEELAELTGKRLTDADQILAAARGLLTRCTLVLVSLGSDGAMLVTEDKAWRAWETSKARVAHTVGCGDALLAGFCAAWTRGRGPEAALRFGVACGSACVRTLFASVRTQSEVKTILPKIETEALD
jgi:1-phosphofructokinase family hexose kinase